MAIKKLDVVDEFLAEKRKIDRLPGNSSYNFSGELQADYFSITRRNMNTDWAHIIMYSNRDNNGNILKLIRKNK